MSLSKLIKTIGEITQGQASLSGLVGSSPAAAIASLQRVGSIFVITATSAKASFLRQEIKLFSGLEPLIFPALDVIPGEELRPSAELVGQRLAVLEKLSKGSAVVIAPARAVMAKTLRKVDSELWTMDSRVVLAELVQKLVEMGYKRFDIVGERGEFSVRGGIVDVFPLDFDNPVRLEFLDDKIESIRSFDVYLQRSIEKLTGFSLLPAVEKYEVPVFGHLPKQTLVVFDELMEIKRVVDREVEESTQYLTMAKIKQGAKPFKLLELSAFLKPGDEPIFKAPPSYLGRIADIPQGATVVSRHAGRLKSEVEVEVFEGTLRAGFSLDKFLVLSDKELFGEEALFRKAAPLSKEGVAEELLVDLAEGDFVVHENYGIAKFAGMTTLEIDNLSQEYLLLEFADQDKVYVPPSMTGLVEKYSSGGTYKPRLSSLGTKNWLRTKNRVKTRLYDMTRELLELYAAREKLSGFAYPIDDLWQKELEETFPFDETADQLKAIKETKRDMEKPRPMDRLVCGDVGYGKTEVAIRAAAKAASAGKQVAILVPTTILADQHYNNFRERFSSSPFNVEMLSRFKSKKDQAKIVKSLAEGGVDIIIGTHRLFSKDIKFRNLGLLVIDEEQRFGVRHKERLKKMKKNIDVLTLSATPIPRTLYLSLSGSRDLSVINTPPVDRSPIRTYVLPWSEAVTREAIVRELDRGGQIYFLHNVVETIDGMAAKIRRLVPEAKVGVGHGQMNEKELEKVMLKFLTKKYDVLVCTSIIESGLDISNVNTILIDSADHFGLSQLYQIRGRVGRGAVRAYAYLFYHPAKVMTDQALERLKAISEFTALGSGYKLAMRDLEIRGAGNLLGREQSGHVMEVGF
ncbi:MAG: transcription-repair coupling factor, partial [bacterium]